MPGSQDTKSTEERYDPVNSQVLIRFDGGEWRILATYAELASTRNVDAFLFARRVNLRNEHRRERSGG